MLMENGCDSIGRAAALAAFGEEETAREAETPDLLYPRLLEQVHGALARRFGLESSVELDAAFGASIPQWPSFPDTADALRALKAHYKLVILSNVNRDGFAASNRKLGVAFDAVYTAEDVGSYKPDSANFEYMIEHLKTDLGVGPGDVLHTAQSLYHDHVPVAALTLASAWIDRQDLSGGGDWGATAKVAKRPEVAFRFPSMGAMAQAVAEAAA